MSSDRTLPLMDSFLTSESEIVKKDNFDVQRIYNFPNSDKKVQMFISRIDMKKNVKSSFDKVISSFISPYGIEFKGPPDIQVGMLLKVQVTIPDYWVRMQRMVDYKRVDTPRGFRTLIKVLEARRVGVRSRKKVIISKIVNIDPIDQRVLSEYISGVKK